MGGCVLAGFILLAFIVIMRGMALKNTLNFGGRNRTASRSACIMSATTPTMYAETFLAKSEVLSCELSAVDPTGAVKSECKSRDRLGEGRPDRHHDGRPASGRLNNFTELYPAVECEVPHLNMHIAEFIQASS